MTRSSRLVPFLIAAALAACSEGPPQGSTPYVPTAAMTKILVERMNMNAEEPADLPVATARDVPSLVDAEHAIPNVAGLPAPELVIQRFSQPPAEGATGEIGANLYLPGETKNTPIIIFFPAENWVARSEAASDEIGRQLAHRTGYAVLVLMPRTAPNATFPAIHRDALAAYRWALSHLREWGTDPTRVALGGAGPGADLALATALAARDRATNLPVPHYLLLITPWVGTSTSTPSMVENAGARPLSRATVRWSQRLYADDALADPRMDPVDHANLVSLPPTTIVTAQIDPTRSDAELLVERLRAAGVPTRLHAYRGVTAEFFGLADTVPEAALAEDAVAADLHDAFNRSTARR